MKMKKHDRSAKNSHDWAAFTAVERPVERFSPYGRHKLALAYANTYHVGMSSLGYQRVHELVHTPARTGRASASSRTASACPSRSRPAGRWTSSAASPSRSPSRRTTSTSSRCSTGPASRCRRKDRNPWDPVIVMGGSCASINPLPMSEFIDVFAIGAAENVLPALSARWRRRTTARRCSSGSPRTPGFYVPAHHHPEERHRAPQAPQARAHREQMRQPGTLPTTAIVTPNTEFADKFLIEMSRGCPEKCSYCWATFGMGRFRWHPTEDILGSIERARRGHRPARLRRHRGRRPPGDRAHPARSHELGFRTSVSSIRIPAVTERRARGAPRLGRPLDHARAGDRHRRAAGARWASRSATSSCSRRSA